MDEPVGEQPVTCNQNIEYRSQQVGKPPIPRVGVAIGFALCILLVGFQVVSRQRTPPLFFSMGDEWRRIAGENFIGFYHNLDTLLEHELYVLSDTGGQPLLFFSDIVTPVCIDGICKPVYLELYWDLVGNYVGYGVHQDRPLTKFDHEEFSGADYEKLHRLLRDDHSVLHRKTLEELFDKNAEPAKKIEYKGEELDAVSGATLKEIKESIIEGALYSCYTLWHLVHGEATRKIEQYVQSIYSKELERTFLHSSYEDYHFYALKHMDEGSIDAYLPRIAEVFLSDKPLIRTYILKKLPIKVWAMENYCRQWYGLFSQIDVSSKTLLINYLKDAHPIAREILSSHMETMSKNHLQAYLHFLAQDRTRITPIIRTNLQRVADSEEYVYSYLIDQFLTE